MLELFPDWEQLNGLKLRPTPIKSSLKLAG